MATSSRARASVPTPPTEPAESVESVELPDFVRVTDEVTPRREYTISRERYLSDPDVFTVLDKPAVLPDGSPIAPKYHTTVDAEAAKAAASNTQTPEASPAPGDQTASEPADQAAVTPADEKKE